MPNLPGQKNDDQRDLSGMEEILDALGDAGDKPDSGDAPSGDGAAQGGDDGNKPGEGGDAPKGDGGDDQAGEGGDKPTETPPADNGEEESVEVALRKQVEELSAQLLQARSGQQPPQAQPDQPPANAAQLPIEVAEHDFLQDEDLDLLLTDKAKVNALLSKVVKFSVEASVNLAHERVLRAVPEVVRSAAQQQLAIDGAVKKFYEDRPHLATFKSAVAAAATGVHSEHPDWPLEKVLEEAAKRTERVLSLRAEGNRTPAFPSTPGGSPNRAPKGDKLSAMEKEILELLEED